ncbi:MAG: IgGFc-binding protein, partial [Myxococcales bacterium]|nr:IgGFc-binding protein [Myxococcales bacterium]
GAEEGTATTASGTETETDSETDTASSSSEGTTAGPECADDEIICMDGQAFACAGGQLGPGEACADACVDGLGCVACVPGESACEGEVVMACDDEGQGYFELEVCDPVQGTSCDPDQGRCEGACAPKNITPGALGCEFFPTVTSNLNGPGDDVPYAIAVANPSAGAATITVEFLDVAVANEVVASGQSVTIPLEWVFGLTGVDPESRIVKNGAYRLRSDRPVVVWQHSPLGVSGSVDAAILLPFHTWSDSHVVASYPGLDDPDQGINYPSFYAVTAGRDQTQLTLSPPPGGVSVAVGQPGIQADGSGVANLNHLDVLQVFSVAGDDLTGARVDSSRPVQVIGGSTCAFVPDDATFCDHLEESMIPIAAAGDEFVIAPPGRVDDPTAASEHVVRIIGLEDDTSLTIDPNPGVGASLASAGAYVELPASADAYWITADKPVIVAQYMLGVNAMVSSADPAMLAPPAVEQFSEDAIFVTHAEWPDTRVDIVAPEGAAVTVDGNAVSGFNAIGGSGYAIARVTIAASGVHTLSADAPVGASVYGYVPDPVYASYWAPVSYVFP